jgi:hypothetical protein
MSKRLSAIPLNLLLHNLTPEIVELIPMVMNEVLVEGVCMIFPSLSKVANQMNAAFKYRSGKRIKTISYSLLSMNAESAEDIILLVFHL